jgi:hypothetical protein
MLYVTQRVGAYSFVAVRLLVAAIICLHLYAANQLL